MMDESTGQRLFAERALAIAETLADRRLQVAASCLLGTSYFDSGERIMGTGLHEWDEGAGAYGSRDAAEGWRRGAATRAPSVGLATDLMLDMAKLANGSRLLDVAAGTGEQTILAARRVGPTGSVLATDIAARMLKVAAEAAHLAGLGNVTTQVMDAQRLDTTRLPRLERIVREAVTTESLDRSLMLPPEALAPRPPADGGHFHPSGVPRVNFLTAPSISSTRWTRSRRFTNRASCRSPGPRSA